jgi:hypothetical protein
MAVRPPRRFTIPQAKRRLKALSREIAAIGGAYDQSVGEMRRRLLALLAAVHELIERFPSS